MCAYLSLPHMALDAMLKITNAKVALFDDLEMALLVKQNIRGGHSFVNLRYARIANERFQSLLFLDANNLYGWAMRQFMPVGEYEWADEDEIARLSDPDYIASLGDEDDIGYALEVDLDYPEDLHLKHNSFPLAPANVTITEKDLSSYSRVCHQQFTHKTGGGRYRFDDDDDDGDGGGGEEKGGRRAKYSSKKLTATFRRREKYLVHYRNLKFYLAQGLKLVKVHKAVKFRQSAFIRGFIDLCTEMRARSKTEMEKEMWKLFANSVYGKFIESLEKRMDVKFNEDSKAFCRRVTSPLYKGSVILDNDTSLSFMTKKKVVMKQCWLVGFTILELSKLKMGSLFYDHLRPALGDDLETVLSDTDSFLLYNPELCDLHSLQRLKRAGVMDFSNLDKSHALYSEENKKVPGFLKNELPNRKIYEAVGVKSKSYCIKTHKGKCVKEGERACTCKMAAKGVKRSVKDRLTFEDYMSCLVDKVQLRVRMNTLQSWQHVNRLITASKVAFSSLDDKRYQLCPHHSAPYGSWVVRVKEKANICVFCCREQDYWYENLAENWDEFGEMARAEELETHPDGSGSMGRACLDDEVRGERRTRHVRGRIHRRRAAREKGHRDIASDAVHVARPPKEGTEAKPALWAVFKPPPELRQKMKWVPDGADVIYTCLNTGRRWEEEVDKRKKK